MPLANSSKSTNNRRQAFVSCFPAYSMFEQTKYFANFSVPTPSNPDQLKQLALVDFVHGPASSCAVKGTVLDQSPSPQIIDWWTPTPF